MPAVTAEDLGARSRRGWIFRHVDLEVGVGELVALTGPPGTGRTSLLLALAGRFATAEGQLRRDGDAALGHVPGVHEPEPALTVGEHLTERTLLLGDRRPRPSRLVPFTAGRARRADRLARSRAALAALGDDAPHWRTPARDLTPLERQLLGLALATLSHPRLVVADDIDTDLDTDERARLWRVLADLADQGHAVVVTAREADPTGPARIHPMGGRR